MVNKALLKKPWKSPRGKIYPAGSTFELIKRNKETSCSIYNFEAPGVGYGWVVFPDKIFKKLTEEEVSLREIRRKMVEEHIRKANDFFGIRALNK